MVAQVGRSRSHVSTQLYSDLLHAQKEGTFDSPGLPPGGGKGGGGGGGPSSEL